MDSAAYPFIRLPGESRGPSFRRTESARWFAWRSPGKRRDGIPARASDSSGGDFRSYTSPEHLLFERQERAITGDRDQLCRNRDIKPRPAARKHLRVFRGVRSTPEVDRIPVCHWKPHRLQYLEHNSASESEPSPVAACSARGTAARTTWLRVAHARSGLRAGPPPRAHLCRSSDGRRERASGERAGVERDGWACSAAEGSGGIS